MLKATIFITFFVFFLNACNEAHQIDVHVGGDVVFDFSQISTTYPNSKLVVKKLLVMQKDCKGYCEAWRIEGNQFSETVTSVSYGSTPKGMKGSVKKTLTKGDYYVAGRIWLKSGQELYDPIDFYSDFTI